MESVYRFMCIVSTGKAAEMVYVVVVTLLPYCSFAWESHPLCLSEGNTANSWRHDGASIQLSTGVAYSTAVISYNWANWELPSD